jgi:hypothetical protein
MVLSGVVTPGLGSEETALLGEGRPGAGLVVVAAGGGVPGGGGAGAGAEDEVVEAGGGGVAGRGGAEGTEVLGSCRFAWRCLGLIFSAAITESWRAEIRSNACNFMTTGAKEGGSRQRVEDKGTRNDEQEKKEYKPE